MRKRGQAQNPLLWAGLSSPQTELPSPLQILLWKGFANPDYKRFLRPKTRACLFTFIFNENQGFVYLKKNSLYCFLSFILSPEVNLKLASCSPLVAAP